MIHGSLERRIDAVRRFNRFYTRQLGLLQEGLLQSRFSLTEARVLYELARWKKTNATDLCEELRLDHGYLSRILQRFSRAGIVTTAASPHDSRQKLLSLSLRGRRAFAVLNNRSRDQAGQMLRGLTGREQRDLLEAMRKVEAVLDVRPEPTVPYLIRAPEPGDMGWVVHRHGVLYAREYGYDERFEALVAGIVAEFVENFSPRRERCWIAERDGEIAGSVFLVQDSARVAKLRLLLVEPAARGLGIGKRLVSECVRFARQAGYRKIKLWTQSELRAAQHVYEAAGFKLTHSKKHHSFGKKLVANTWELKL
jgi:DNA-binding MarR family transcriptional regulator/GNAT superfamily N-acetyltransferase